jgi:hypothetical protein
MCGIWACCVERQRYASLHLQAVALRSAQRGPHAHGWHAHGQPLHRALGALSTIQSAAMLRDAEASPGLRVSLVGHARLATTRPGSRYVIDDAQPIRRGLVTICHNGVVPTRVSERLGSFMTSGNDSELVAIFAARLVEEGEPIDQALLGAVYELELRDYAICAMSYTGDVACIRGGNLPLHVGSGYASSASDPDAANLLAATPLILGAARVHA